ncbi:LuxR family transcriptional regulator [Amycolatopsis sp. 195334CR]|uniref:AAA family ATPase n=1 Tax=Amycolatopsis sp. 195334CR TaxID=2814588 RepID=UPI001A8F2003|nr:LuxR family transcriptional regulator [Amycolatopsis sp. 195334CR]MBN6040673.1 AAA family ATPase [Amycolatopsis sp. 195334CR]
MEGSTQHAPRLRGRTEQLCALGHHLDAVAGGRPGILNLTGTVGSGKTALLTAATADACARGFRVLTARSARLERDFVFGVVRQLLESTVFEAAPADRERLLGGPAAFAVEVLEAGPSATAVDLHSTFHSLWHLSRFLAEGSPLLLVIDDVHFADSLSTQWLDYVSRRLSGQRIGILTASAADPGPFGKAPGVTGARQLEIGGLDTAAITEIVTDTLGEDVSPEFVRTCHTVTAGNPALLEGLLRSCHGARGERLDPSRFGAQELATTVYHRLEQEDTALVALAQAIAALEGTDTDLELAAAVAGLPASATFWAARRLREMSLLAETEALTFTERGIQAAIACRLTPQDLHTAHAKAARFLNGVHAPCARVAAHLQETRQVGQDWAVHTLLNAAREAIADGDPNTAVVHLRRVLHEPLSPEQRNEVLFELGSAEIHADPPAAVHHLSMVESEAADPRRQAAIAALLAGALSECDRFRESLNVLQHAVDRLDPAHPELASELETEILYLSRHDPHTATTVPQRLANLRRRNSSTPQARRRLNAFVAEHGAVALDHMSAAALRRLALDSTPPGPLNDLGELRAFGAVVGALSNLEEYDLALQICEEVLDDRRRSLPLATGLASAYCADIRYQVGQLTAARSDAQTARDKLEAFEIRRGIIPALLDGTEMRLAAVQHDTEAAERLLARHRHIAKSTYLRTCMALHGRGLLHASLGNHTAALNDQLDCGRRLERFGYVDHPQIPWRVPAALAQFQLGNHEEAILLAKTQLAFARKRGLPRTLGIALHTAATVTEGARSIDLLTEAVDVLGRSQAKLEFAQAQAELAVRLGGSGGHEQAATMLNQAMSTATSCGAIALAGRIHRQLHSPAAAQPQVLTRREHNIATLAAQGKSNPEIAQALVLSRRTIEFHLTNIYRKLGISRRNQLTQSLVGSTTPTAF